MSRDPLHPNRIASLPRAEKHWNWSKNPSVLAMHKRIHRKYGKASSYRCADCPNQAHDWSLEPGKQYSSNVEDYKPRCRACHLKIDMTAERRQNVSVGLKKAYAEGRR